MDAIFAGLPGSEVEVIVATDSAGILGIGDQGVGGMGIPIGKLSLYTAGAGINPARCLPVTLDVGTDNKQLLEDPHYLGVRRPRMRGAEYFDLVDRFVQAVKRHFPSCLLQWEDFSKENAWSLLEKYRGELLSFNDDIQGTGAVVLTGIVCAVRDAGQRLRDQVYVLYGSGAAGIGVAAQIRTALVAEGLTPRRGRGAHPRARQPRPARGGARAHRGLQAPLHPPARRSSRGRRPASAPPGCSRSWRRRAPRSCSASPANPAASTSRSCARWPPTASGR